MNVESVSMNYKNIFDYRVSVTYSTLIKLLVSS